MTTVFLAENPLEPQSWERHDVEDLRAFLMERWSTWPATGRIFQGQVAESCDVTPRPPVPGPGGESTPAEVERYARELDLLAGAPGPLYVVIYPAGLPTVAIVIAGIALAASVAMAFLLKPSIPSRNQQPSPNNDLGERKNQARPGSRIPDILGTVRSIPDLLTQPYRVFEDQREVEYAYLCIGRGAYEVSDVRDGDTLVSLIEGASCAIYGPYSSPRSGTAPQLQIGPVTAEPLQAARRCDSVDGQTLLPPNRRLRVDGNNIRFVGPNRIELRPETDYGFLELFGAGESITIEAGAAFPAGATGGAWYTVTQDAGTYRNTYALVDPPVNPYDGTPLPGGTMDGQGLLMYGPNPEFDQTVYYWFTTPVGDPLSLAGTYTIQADGAGNKLLLLDAPEAVNPNWAAIETTERDGQYSEGTLFANAPRWVGPFLLESDTLTRAYANLIAPNGLYRDDGKNQTVRDVTVELELTPVGEDGETPRGSPELFQGTVQGSSTTRAQRALTLKAAPTFTGKCLARMRRVTEADLSFNGTVVDEVKWRDAYAMSPVTQTHFGDVTTAYATTYATRGALAVKDRKLNMRVTRKVKRRGVSDPGFDANGAPASGLDADGFSNALLPTNRLDDLFVHVCRDPRIGNRSLDELNLGSIYGTVADIVTYFGTELAAEFSYTWDKDNASFEETVATMASAGFSVAYRRGSQIQLSFEKATEDSVLLFNHRNKWPPSSEERSFTFGPAAEYDGIEYQWVDPKDDALVTLYLPRDRSAVNPKKIESVGVRNGLQAYLQAHRIWNKLQYQNETVEFEATQEADLLVLADRILVADNVRPFTQDGRAEAQDGLVVTTSQPVSLPAGKSYTIFLQHADGSVESMPVTAGPTDTEVVLSRAPKAPLSLEDEAYAKATYWIVEDTNPRARAFLVMEKEPQSSFTTKLTAANYDSRYYGADLDYLNGLVDEAGIPTGANALVGPGLYASEDQFSNVLSLLEALVNVQLRD